MRESRSTIKVLLELRAFCGMRRMHRDEEDGRDDQGEEGGDGQAADDGDGERALHGGAGAESRAPRGAGRESRRRCVIKIGRRRRRAASAMTSMLGRSGSRLCR